MLRQTNDDAYQMNSISSDNSVDDPRHVASITAINEAIEALEMNGDEMDI